MLKQIRFPLVVLVFVLLLANTIVLDILFFTQGAKNSNPATENSITTPVGTVPNPENSCPASCLTEISKATQTAVPSAKPSAPSSQTQGKSQVKEFLVALGSGTGQSSDWTNVPGVGATINSESYGSIKAAFFEVSITLPTANDTTSLRLYDVTDNHPVWYSQIDSTGETTAFLTSQAIHLEPGSKLYQVQMKTLLTDHPVTLIQSRIRITTN